MIRSVSIVVVWILAVEGERIILHSGSAADADRGNGTAEGKWNNEIDNGDYNDDEGFANENFQDNDIYDDNNTIITEILIKNANGNGSSDENNSTRQEDDEIDKAEDCSTEEANIVDYPQSIPSTPKDHVWMKKEMIDEDLNIVVKTNVKRVKRASRAGSSRKVKVAQERHNNRFDNSNSSKKNQNHRKYKVADN
ncbi:Midasin [Dirofilaria immitis]